MAVSAWSNILTIGRCTVCAQRLPASDATIACGYTGGQPALACDVHRNDKADWVAAWVTFYRQQHNATAPGNVARLYIETRQAKTVPDIKVDVGWHLFTRSMAGRCVIITDEPVEFLSVLRKHWKSFAKVLHLERARTLDTQKRLALQEALGRLQILSFSSTVKNMHAEALVVSPHNIRLLTGDYATIYICTDLNDAQKSSLLKSLPPGALCVDYTNALQQWGSVA